jgi:hypothetical protein
MLEKISEAQVKHILIKSASALRNLRDENADLKRQLAERDRHDYAEKIASQAVDRGVIDPTEAADYAEKLASSAQDLKMVEEFVSHAAAGVPLGQTLEKTASDNYDGGDGGTDVLTSFLLTSDFAG